MTIRRTEQRRALRIAVDEPTTVEVIGQPQIALHQNLARVYERVESCAQGKGERYECTIADLSTNGAFFVGEPLPLLSRVAFAFSLPTFGTIDALGWVLWRRREDCSIPSGGGSDLELKRGFGVLFEAIPIPARLAIHDFVCHDLH